MPFDFSGKKILVTGAGSGIGRELAKTIVKAGGEVYALDRTKENIYSLANESENIHPIIVDLNDWEATRQELDKLDVLDGVVNNAAAIIMTSESGGLGAKRESFEEALRVNTLAPINVIQSTARKMIEAGKHGSIVNVSSAVSVKAYVIVMEYGISKACLDMVTKQFALELGPHQIRVNSVNPTWVMTDKIKEFFVQMPNVEATRILNTPMKRFLELREAIEPILYLLSDHSSMVNGTLHFIDGGLVCNIPIKCILNVRLVI